MTPEQSRLWQKIQDFPLDDPAAAFKFSDKLSRQNGWTLSYAQRVIAEYKKFMLMSCIAKHGVCPSHAVDEAWHQHLTYTQSYWIDFCGKTINRQIHHHPTKGGNQEDSKHTNLYAETFKLYVELFKTNPPADVWPAGGKAATSLLKRVDTRQYWVIRKPGIAVVVLLALLFVPMLFIQAVPAEYSPLIMLGILGLVVFLLYRKYGEEQDEERRRNGGSCSGSGCGSSSDNDGHSGHHGHSCHSGGHSCSGSCSSGDGCSSSGCCSGGGD